MTMHAIRAVAMQLDEVGQRHGAAACGARRRLFEERHLAGATRHAAWLMDHVSWRDTGPGGYPAAGIGTASGAASGAAHGCYWQFQIDTPRQPAWTSLCHGVAGVGAFFALLYQASGDGRWADAVRACATTLLEEARPDRGGRNWLPLVGAATDLDLAWQKNPVRATVTRCQWCNGAPGIGLFFAGAYETLSDAAYLAAAEAAGEATYAYGDGRGNPTYCHGLAGNAELLVELHRITGAQRWRDRALDFSQRMLSYRIPTADGDRWPGDDLGTSAPDFMCGAAGTGHLFLRLMDAQHFPAALL
jgi:lantibiotic modifying enzyme